jgi:hypothetical protein
MSEMPLPESEAHRRAHARLRVGIAARIETLEGQQGVRLVDLSQSGAQVILSEPGEIRRAVLCWLDFEAFGAVVWREGEHLGIEFEELLPMEQLIQTRQLAPSVVRKEVFGDRQAARDWVAGNIDLGSER